MHSPFSTFLQTHTAVSRVIETIEATEQVSFPNKERVLHAYLHFEALTEHDYMFACVTCGYSPAVVVMDLHKKGVFNMAGAFQSDFTFLIYCIDSVQTLHNISLIKWYA